MGKWMLKRVQHDELDRNGNMKVYYDADCDINLVTGKKIAIVDDKSAYGKGLADETRKAMNAAVDDIKDRDRLTRGATEVDPEAARSIATRRCA